MAAAPRGTARAGGTECGGAALPGFILYQKLQLLIQRSKNIKIHETQVKSLRLANCSKLLNSASAEPA